MIPEDVIKAMECKMQEWLAHWIGLMVAVAYPVVLLIFMWWLQRPKGRDCYGILKWIGADVAVIRVFQNGKQWGDPFQYAVVAVFTESHRDCTLMAVMRAPNKDEVRAIRKAIEETGCTSVEFDRYNCGKIRHIRFEPKHKMT